MDSLKTKPSCLCVSPEFKVEPTNHLGGMANNSCFQPTSARPVPSTCERCRNGSIQPPKRPDNTLVDVDFGLGHAFCENRVASAANCHRADRDTRTLDNPLEENGAGNIEMDLVMRTVCQTTGIEESCRCVNESCHESDHCEEQSCRSVDVLCNGDNYCEVGLLEEEDLLAYKITEFFNAFRDGQERNVLKSIEKADLLARDGAWEPGGVQPVVMSKSSSVDVQLSSGKLLTHANDGSSDCGLHANGNGRSGKWSSYLQGDSFSTTSCEPLPISGPIASFGHLGHVTYSGSVSHRSDSSTASTHSFAFPVLPWEWNSSPVKMAQPDKRSTQQPWKRRIQKFFCCTT